VTDHLIGKYVSLEIAHDLVDVDDDFPSEPTENSIGSTRGSIIAH
jgi:hypothetical protein